ncbi:hypothetical protein LXM25_02750 [Dyadobacter sp. LJ53]|uniref:hypothetical protein n=1 Tax=Dyadobacter chenwenxiniae TaxID=2906456 RepID=UPI001F1A0147|nr:hypothetical protein [Dyadobacter chenwenxiniae]MCF0048959.1 hypothetical protein [Dyadobacter chenwenxiniae]
MKNLKKECRAPQEENADESAAIMENSCPKENAAEKCQHSEIKNLSSIDVQQSIKDYNNSLFGNLKQ